MTVKPANDKTSDRQTDVGAIASKFRVFFVPALVFVTALILSMLVAFSRSSIGLATAYDSGLYITCTSSLFQAIQIVLADPAQLEPQCKAISDTIMLNGPVLPLLGCFAYLISGTTPSLFQVQPVLFLMVLFNATTATLIFSISRQLTGDNKFSLTGAFLWILYPSALISTARFLTEPASCLIEITALFVLLKGLQSNKTSTGLFSGLTLGLLTATIILLRPIIAPAFLIVCLLPLFNWIKKDNRKAIAYLAGIICGIIIVLTPWLGFTKLATGNYELTASRQPVFNLFVGFCLELDGEDYVKEPDALKNSSKTEALSIVAAKISGDPVNYSTLILRKLVRLFLYPWNDFRIKVMGLNSQIQSWWHVFLVFAGGLGILAFFSKPKGEEKFFENPKQVIPLVCLIFILVHLLYLLFGTTSRYGFTAMPFFAILTAYFLNQFCSESDTKSLLWKLPLTVTVLLLIMPLDLQGVFFLSGMNSVLSIALTTLLKSLILAASIVVLLKPALPESSKLSYASFSLVIMAIPIVLLAKEGFIPHEYKVDLVPGQSLERQVEINAKRPEWAVLLIDSNEALESSKVSINGSQLETPAPLYRFSMEGSPMTGYQAAAALLKVNIEKLRQWRLIPVPVSILNTGGANTISINPGKTGVSLFGSIPDPGGKLFIPSLNGFRIKKLITNQRDIEGRIPVVNVKTENRQASILKNNNESKPLNGLLRVLLVLGYNNSDTAFNATTLEAELIESPLAIAPGALQFKKTAKPFSIKGKGTLKVSVRGICETSSDDILKSNLVLRRTNRPDSSVSLLNTEKLIKLKPGGESQFQFSNFVPLSGLADTEFFPEISLKAEKQKLTIKALSCDMTIEETPDFRYADYRIY